MPEYDVEVVRWVPERGGTTIEASSHAEAVKKAKELARV